MNLFNKEDFVVNYLWLLILVEILMILYGYAWGYHNAQHDMKVKQNE